MVIPSIQQKEIPHGTRVLVRSALNAPTQDGKVMSTFRINEAVRTLEFLRQKGAKITVISHFGRSGESLAPVHSALNNIVPVSFMQEIVGEKVYTARKNLGPGEILLLENTRIDPRETENDILFAEEIAAQTDLFVFDDFTAAHRKHASTVGLIEMLPAYAGIRFYEEITALLRITERSTSPSLAILGGAKCETKLPLIKNLLNTYDTIVIAGVLANTLLQQKGISIGTSKAEEIKIPEEILSSTKIVLPRDVLVTKDFIDTRMIPIEEIAEGESMVDIGDMTLKTIQHHLENAKTVLLNGPLGWYEKGFFKQTEMVSHMVAKTETYSFAGGGDTAALLEHHNLMNDWKFVSTGGGSLLTYLAEKTLPVIKAFEEKNKKQNKTKKNKEKITL